MGKRGRIGLFFAAACAGLFAIVVRVGIPFLLLLLLAGCASTGQEAAGGGADSEGVPGEEPAAAAGPMDEDVMYRVLAGEYLGSEGELQAAVDEYLEAALASAR